MKLGQNVCLDEISDEFEMDHVGSKTWSQSQMLEKPYVCSRGHIFRQIIMKLGQNFFLDEISNEYENGLCQVKNWVIRSKLTKGYNSKYKGGRVMIHVLCTFL